MSAPPAGVAGPGIFELEMLPAGHGDCLLLTWGDAKSPRRLLVDGGTAASYPGLRQRLERLEPAERVLDVVVVTHIDHDHVGGIVQLLGDRELGLVIGDLWFNGWAQLQRGIVSLPPAPVGLDAMEPSNRSVAEAAYLSFRALQRGVTCNASFDGSTICLERRQSSPGVRLAGGLVLWLLSPGVDELKKLRADWETRIARRGPNPDDPDAVARALEGDRRYRHRSGGFAGQIDDEPQPVDNLPQDLDDAVANGSSIAFLAEFEGRRCVLAGDAFAPVLEGALRRAALDRGEARLRLNAFKLPHHGSKGNVTPGLIRSVDCQRFLFSTNGATFGHPDELAVQRVLQNSPASARVAFNYKTDATVRWTSRTWAEPHLGRVDWPAGDGGITIDLMNDPV